MSTVFVIHRPGDQAFVREHLLAPLPALGFHHWLASDQAAASIGRCAAVIAVVPGLASADQALRDTIATARSTDRPVILVPRRAETLDDDTADDARLAIDAVLLGLPAAEGGSPDGDGRVDSRTLWLSLTGLLPAVARGPDDGGGDGERIAWHDAAFSTLLADAVARLDHQRSAALVGEFARHCKAADAPYSADRAKQDLHALRKKRMFPLMRTYAVAALSSGTTAFHVRRQYAQALIELADFDSAREVLEQLVTAAPKGDDEEYEARGLLGRLYKQLYVNAPDAPGSAAYLQRAIGAYADVFQESTQHLWQGINMATLLIRAARDRVIEWQRDTPRAAAAEILATLADRRKAREARGERIDVWDVATRIEALVAMDDVEEAGRALDEYLEHPDMDAFEVSSTYRQFDEVLQLGSDPRTRPLLDRLWKAVQRHRTSGVIEPDDEPATGDAAGARRRLLLGVSDPAWSPTDVPDLTIHARMGTILSISGTERTVQALMKDPLVISVDESRPAGPPDCARSLPFVNVARNFEFQGTTGPFTEKGDRALVAIIDDGIDILHGAFLDDAGRSRIIGIWDQDDNGGTPPAGFDFGTFYDGATVAALVARRRDPSPDVPQRLRNMNGVGHGSHVASIAAGRPAGQFAGGVAPNARILAVISGGSEATGYSDGHVAALTFIDQIASQRNLPVVVNVSQGMNAGAHDGKSLVEVAFDQFSKGGRTPGRVVVKSAGNERQKKGHAEMTLLRGEGSEFVWTCRTAPWRMDRIELWWNSANEYTFRLRSPGGERSEWVTREAPEIKGSLEGVKLKMEFVRNHVDNGDSRLIVEVGSRFTDRPTGQEWALEVVAGAVIGEDDILHAWIERRNAPPSEFVSTNATERMTLSIPGTATSVITVAAIDAARPIVVGRFSSHGPTRDDRRKPDVCAPGVNVIAARAGTLDEACPMDGTSMAAPHVAGAIALALSKRNDGAQQWPSATQVGALLRQNTLNFTGKWTDGQGYGVIDVAAFLKAF